MGSVAGGVVGGTFGCVGAAGLMMKFPGDVSRGVGTASVGVFADASAFLGVVALESRVTGGADMMIT